MTAKKLKSAYELAMERLREQDRADGRDDAAPLTDEQKREITELRETTRARIAELEILHRKNLAEAGGDPETIRNVEDGYRSDRARLESRLESAIARVRSGKRGRLED